MDKDQFPPDYTPFSLTGSAHADGDREVEQKLFRERSSRFQLSAPWAILLLLLALVGFLALVLIVL